MPFEYRPGIGSTAAGSYSKGNANALTLLMKLMASNGADGGNNGNDVNYNTPGNAGSDFVASTNGVPLGNQGNGMNSY